MRCRSKHVFRKYFPSTAGTSEESGSNDHPRRVRGRDAAMKNMAFATFATWGVDVAALKIVFSVRKTLPRFLGNPAG